MPASEPIYTSETFTWSIPNVKLNGTLVTDVNAPDSFTYEVVDSTGASFVPANTGTMSHSATDGTWEAVVTAPDDSQVIHLHAEITDGQSVGFIHDYQPISSRT